MAKKHKKPKPLGEARYDMPFVVPDPPLANPGLGIDRPALRGKAHSYTIDITVLDTSDHRLIRTGVLLAHRVADGLGDWYLNAREWAPPMPEELSVPMDAEGDLPDELARLVRPFRRLAPLGPVAAVTLERNAYTIRGTVDEGGLVLATLRDDRFTIRRGGVAISRVREVTLRPTPAMGPGQYAHVLKVLTASGGTRVDEFPELRGHLGAPATGLSDVPRPRPWRDDQTLEEYVARVFTTRLRALLMADLGMRSGSGGQASDLLAELRALATEVRGFSGVLEPEWRGRLEDRLDVLLQQQDADAVVLREHEDSYMGVLDALVSGARAPRLGDHARRPASEEMQHQVTGLLTVLRDRCAALTVGGESRRWDAALATARQLRATAQAAGELEGAGGRRLRTEVDDLIQALEPAAGAPAEPAAEELLGMSAAEAFAAGRDHQRRLDEFDQQRDHFVETWPKRAKRLKKALAA